jgi:hypothetical protein
MRLRAAVILRCKEKIGRMTALSAHAKPTLAPCRPL